MDVLLRQSINDGDICLEDGVVVLDGGLETSAYLSLFGGNDEEVPWWGNVLETDPVRQLTSRTQRLLAGLSTVPPHLLRLRDAAVSDLAWMLTAGVASSVEVDVALPTLRRVQFTIEINAEGPPERFAFFANWGEVTA